MSERITITVAAGGDDADARAFAAVFQDILDLLDALSAERYKTSPKINWKIISLEKHSPPVVTLESRSRRKLASVLIAGLTVIQAGSGKRPFGMATLKIAKRLGDRVDTRQVDNVTIKTARKEFKPTPELANNAEELLEASFYEMPSSVDGKLDIVNVHAGPRFSIFDDVTKREIRCRFPEDLIEKVRSNLGKRITASGVVRFSSATDRPTSIKVDDIDPMDGNETILSLEEMPVIDIVGNEISPEQFVRNQRDGR